MIASTAEGVETGRMRDPEGGPFQDTPPPSSGYHLSLHVHRLTADGRAVVDKMELVAVSDVGKLTGVFRKLLEKAFSGRLPEYMTSEAYYLFRPRDEFVSTTEARVVATQFRLVVEVDGWETVVCVRGGRDDCNRGCDGCDGCDGFRHASDESSSMKKMLIAMAQFDSEPVVMGDGVTEMTVCVEGYSVSVEKAFLDRVSQELLQDHARFYRERFESDFPALEQTVSPAMRG